MRRPPQAPTWLVFPELFTTGYHLDTVGPRMTELAEPIDGPTVRALQEAARKNHVYIVAPIALLHGLSGVPYNSAVFINSDGTVQGSFDKVHLWALERFYFRAGHEFPVFDTEFGKVGIMVCYDMGFPEAARTLALKGAELIVCPSAWCVQDADVWEINAPARALENTVFLARGEPHRARRRRLVHAWRKHGVRPARRQNRATRRGRGHSVR